MIEKRVCFIGVDGHCGCAYEELKDLPGVSFCGIAPGVPDENVSAFAGGSIPIYTDWREMLNTVKPDMAVVSTVFGINAEITVECCKQGVDVFTEKPVAGTLEELALVEKAVKENGVRLCAVYY